MGGPPIGPPPPPDIGPSGGGGGGLTEEPPLRVDPSKNFAIEWTKHVDELFDTYANYAEKKGIPRWVYAPICLAFALLGATATDALAAAVSILIPVLAPLAGDVLSSLSAARNEHADQLNEVMAQTMSEMFGVEVTSDDLPSGAGPEVALVRARVIGAKIMDLLEGEFTAGGELSPEQGKRAANIFTGFTANFAVASAFMGIIGELVSLGQIENIRELGVELAETLGLGRLSRRGTSELVGTTVADPFEWYLNKKYRPKRFGATEVVRAWLSRHLTAEEMREELAQAGYSNQRIAALIESHSKDLSVQQLKILFTAGRLTKDDFELLMGRQGWTPELTQRWTEAELLFEARSNAITIARRVLDDVVNGIVSPDEYETMMGRLNLAKVEIEGFRAQAGELSRLPRRTLTLGQMRQAFIDGIVDVSEWQDYLIRQGYGRDDRQILTLQVLLDAKQQAEADALRKERERERQERRQAQAAKSQTPPPTP